MRDKVNDPMRLSLMLESIGNIDNFMSGIDSCDVFISNKLLCHAVIYNLQCIGECSYKLSRDYVACHSEVDWKSMEGLRHILVHDYYTVDMKMVWEIMKKDLPALKHYLLEHGV